MLVVAAAFASAADARQAHRTPISGRGAGYDGYWNVLIITGAGTCDRTYSFPVQIAGGHVLSGGMAEVAGSVGRHGVVTVRVSSGGSYANGSGRLGVMADRFALILLPVTLVVAFLAWRISGDLTRSLAVLVAATPCPLILAAPVAFIAGWHERPGAASSPRVAGRWRRWPALTRCCLTKPAPCCGRGAIAFDRGRSRGGPG